MNQNDELNELLADTLCDDTAKERSLSLSLGYLRRRKHIRKAYRIVASFSAAVAVLLYLVFLVKKDSKDAIHDLHALEKIDNSTSHGVAMLSDDELVYMWGASRIMVSKDSAGSVSARLWYGGSSTLITLSL